MADPKTDKPAEAKDNPRLTPNPADRPVPRDPNAPREQSSLREAAELPGQERVTRPGEAESKIDETIEGGAYMRNTKIIKGKHYGGQVVNANGKVLKEFKDNEVNTGAKGLSGREIEETEMPEFSREGDEIKGKK